MYEYGVRREGDTFEFGLTVMTEDQAKDFVEQVKQDWPTSSNFYIVRRTVTPWERV